MNVLHAIADELKEVIPEAAMEFRDHNPTLFVIVRNRRCRITVRDDALTVEILMGHSLTVEEHSINLNDPGPLHGLMRYLVHYFRR